MKKHALACFLLVSILSRLAVSQSQAELKPPVSIVIKAGKLLDVRKGSYIGNAAVWAEAECVKEVATAKEIAEHAPKDAKVIDLGSTTLLPGLIDCHTHIMARMPDTDDGYTVSLATESQVFRALEGSFDAHLTLKAGFTALRDVESEGSGG